MRVRGRVRHWLFFAALCLAQSCSQKETLRLSLAAASAEEEEGLRAAAEALLARGFPGRLVASGEAADAVLRAIDAPGAVPAGFSCTHVVAMPGAAPRELATLYPLESFETMDGAVVAVASARSQLLASLVLAAHRAGLGVEPLVNVEELPREGALGVVFSSTESTGRYWLQARRVDATARVPGLESHPAFSLPAARHLFCLGPGHALPNLAGLPMAPLSPTLRAFVERPPAPPEEGLATFIFGQGGERAEDFLEPEGVIVDSEGRVAVSDERKRQVIVFSHDGHWLFSYGGPGKEPGRFGGSVAGLAIHRGEVFATDPGNSRVQVFDEAGRPLRQFGRRGTGPGEFFSPIGIAVAPDGTVYVSDDGRSDVQAFTKGGTWLRTVGSRGSGPGQFQGVESLAVSPATGELYVADEMNRRIQVFDASGRYLRALGDRSGPAAFAADIEGLVFDKQGRLWALDEDNGRLLAFSDKGEPLGELGGGVGSLPGQMLSPDGLTYHPGLDLLYVVDELNYRVQAFSPAKLKPLEARAEQAASDRVLVLGRMGAPAEAFSRFGPLAKLLGQRVSDRGANWRGLVRPAASLEEMARALKAREVDLLIDSSLAMLELVDQGVAEPLLAAERKKVLAYHSVLFSRKDAPLARLEELVGKVIAFEDPTSTSAYILPAGLLRAQGLELEQLDSTRQRPSKGKIGYVFAGDERTIAAWVYEGRVAAGALSDLDLTELGDLAAEFQVIERSPTIAYYLAVVRTDLDGAVKARLAEVLGGFSKDEELKAAAKLSGITAVHALDSPQAAPHVENAKQLRAKLSKKGAPR